MNRARERAIISGIGGAKMQKSEYFAVKGIGGGLTDYSLLIYYRQMEWKSKFCLKERQKN